MSDKDTREKLLDDVEEIMFGDNRARYDAQKHYLVKHGLDVDECIVTTNHEGHVAITVIMHLLDRQADITSREWESELDQLHMGYRPIINELRNKIGALEDELADKTEFIDHQEREIAELEFEAKYNRRRIEELNSELVQQIKLITRMWSEICSCPEYRNPPCMTDEICGLMREFGFRQIIEQRNEEP